MKLIILFGVNCKYIGRFIRMVIKQMRSHRVLKKKKKYLPAEFLKKLNSNDSSVHA